MYLHSRVPKTGSLRSTRRLYYDVLQATCTHSCFFCHTRSGTGFYDDLHCNQGTNHDRIKTCLPDPQQATHLCHDRGNHVIDYRPGNGFDESVFISPGMVCHQPYLILNCAGVRASYSLAKIQAGKGFTKKSSG